MSTLANIAVTAMLTLMLASPTTFAAEIVGHRGASADAPENTLASFKLGYQQNADADELDIHLTKDGKIVVIHDYDTKRVGGVDKKVVDQTFDEIRAINVGAFGKWAGKGFNEKLPTLDEVLALIPPGKKLLIEIKVHEEILPALAETLKRASVKPEQTIIITFYLEVAQAAKKMFPDRKVYWLHSYAKDKKTGKFPDLDDVIAKAKKAGVDGIDLQYNFPLDAAAIKKIHAAGLECHVWTLDDPIKARELIKAGVDSITTNRPGELRRELQSTPQK
jgi:glycerophosphoryl diester phosphodiesterase